MSTRTLLLVTLALSMTSGTGCGPPPGLRPTQPIPPSASGRGFAAAANSTFAVDAARTIRDQGGNAVDAAIAMMAMLWVTDPANDSPLGRSQWIIGFDDGREPLVWNGATRAVPVSGPTPRRGWQVVPLPGNLDLIALLIDNRLTSLPLEKLFAPAIARARAGFVVTPTYAEIWARMASRLAEDPATAAVYLRPDGAPFRAGDWFRNPGMADFLTAMSRSGQSGADGLRDFAASPFAQKLLQTLAAHGVHWFRADLERRYAHRGRKLEARLGQFRVVTSGEPETWGHSLIAMLKTAYQLSQLRLLRPRTEPDLLPAEVEALLLTEIVGLEGTPYEIGTLRPKPYALPLPTLVSNQWAHRAAEEVQTSLRKPRWLPQHAASGVAQATAKGDTTAASVVVDGTWVHFTSSIGPWFGASRAIDGVLLAHSYNMANAPEVTALTPDRTEQAPTLVLRDGKPVIAIGAAGNEKIVGAVFFVLAIKLLLRPDLPLADCVAMPRLFPQRKQITTHLGFSAAVLQHLVERGYPIELTGRGIRKHLGIVNVVGREGTGLTAVSDPASQGAAVAGE